METHDSDEIEAEQRIAQALYEGATQLDLSRLKLSVLPDSLIQLTQLKSLSLSSTGLASLPESLGPLTQLQTLNLYNTGLTSLPESLGQLTQLQTLILHNTGLTSLPESLGQLARLQTLNLSNNRLTSLPESLGQLTQLQTLDLSETSLTSLPESLGPLTQLQTLNLYNVSLTSLPESLGQLTQLQTLNLSHTGLTSLPESLGQLARLQRLNLSHTGLTSLPESLGQLTQLRTLDLSHNGLTSLPESLGQLAQLQGLDLSHNGLTSLPESLGQLTQLRTLDLSLNGLTSLPESLARLALKALYLHGNDKLEIPVEVLGAEFEDVHFKRKTPANPSEILSYYFRIRTGKRPLNEVKLILLGRGGVGKTSLVNGLVHGTFDPDSAKTKGIKITQWPVKVDGETVRVHVWDFGGQEIMHATHQFFLTERTLYLVVLSGREGSEDADAEYWLKLVESFGGESPVFVVLNKMREHRCDVNRRALKQKYPNIRKFMETDCKTPSLGIKDVDEALSRELSDWKDWRVSFPKSWFAIKERLAGMKESYLSFERFRQICCELLEEDGKSQEELAGHLHKLGIALNYKDDPRLRDTHVLNPHWVTEGIYLLLNAPLLAERKGDLRTDDLPDILPGDTYPRGMHPFVLDLMRKFELCFPYQEETSRYLVPELLDKQQPLEVESFSPEDCLGFEYHYPILPEGLLPRFIVRTHSLSAGQPRWRSGVILQFEKCRALVKADVAEKTVQILISGPLQNRRRLLAVIRSDFERIHDSIRDLKPQEMVAVPGRQKLLVPYRKLETLERAGKRTFEEVFEDEVVELNVAELLSGVELSGSRRRTLQKIESMTPVRVFFSYSSRDEGLRNELKIALTLLERQGLITAWYDRLIQPGEDWAQGIDDNLESADLILLLVSDDFNASNYCYDKEMIRALERHDAGEARVIPIILRDANWKSAPYARLQVLPKDGKAVTLWTDRDSAWRNVSEGIERFAQERRASIHGEYARMAAMG